jgi:hypothetical protein
VDTFVEAPEVATLVEGDFELLEHAPKTREAAAPVATRPIEILRIDMFHLSIAENWDRTVRPRQRCSKRLLRMLHRGQPGC